MKRALIVDDKPENRNLLRSLLQGRGWEVTEARHGAEELALARQDPPDIVITDLLLPVMDGYTLLRHWKADPVLQDLPLVIYTATGTDPQTERLALDLGAAAFIVKPAEPADLLAQLDRVWTRAAPGQLPAADPLTAAEPPVLHECSEALVRRLEDRSRQLELANRELREREARLRAILDTEPVCVKLLAADGSLLEMNPAGLRMIEADSLAQMRNQSVYPLVDEEHRAAFRELTARVFRGESGTLEFRITGLQGGRRWLETNATPLRDAAGKVAALLGITRDITARKEAEAEQAKELRAMTLLQGIAATFVQACEFQPMLDRVLDAAITVTHADMASLQLRDPSSGCLLIRAHRGFSRPWLDFWEQVAEDEGTCGTAMRRGERVVVEDVEQSPLFVGTRALEVQLAAGVRAVVSTPLFAPDGQLVGMFSVHFRQPHQPGERELQRLDLLARLAADLIAHTRAEAALRDSEDRFRRLSDAAFEGVVIHDQGRILDVNQGFCALYQCDRADEVIGMSVLETTAPESRDAVRQHLQSGSEEPYEAIGLRKDGSRILTELRGRPLVVEGRTVRVVAIRDITARKEAEARIAHLSRLYATLSKVSEAIVRTRTRAELFPAICCAAVEHGRMALAWIGLLDPATGSVVAAAAQGAGAEQAAALRLDLSDTQVKIGLMSRALATGRLVVSRDIQSDPTLVHMRPLAEAHGLRAAAAVPFRCQGAIAGFLILVAAEVDYFVDPELQDLISEMATDISFALDAMEVEAQRRQAEKALHDLAHAVNTAGDVVFLTDREGIITQVNEQFTALYGHAAADVVGKVTPRVLKSGRHSLQYYQQVWARLLRGEAVKGEVCNRASDGRLLDIEETITPFHDERGELTGFLAVQREIGARKRAEQEIVVREARFRNLIENASDLVSELDQRGVIRFQGPSIERLLGWRPEQMVGHPAFEWIHPDDVPQVSAAIQRAVAQPAASVSIEYRFRHQDGSWHTLESIGRRIDDAAGEPMLVVNSRDVTAGRQMEEQLRQAQKMEAIGQLAGGVAHDFNNILAVIMGWTELMKEQPELPPAVRDGLEQTGAAAERAAALTRQLLLFSRRQVMQSSQLDLNETVTSLARMLQRIIGEDVRLELHLHPEPLWTRADAGMLDQVLMNLAVNARDAMPRGGELRLETVPLVVDQLTAKLHSGAAPGVYACLRVSDTGCGIAPEVLPHVFEPFFTTKETGKGTGLGLATVFGIVRQHSGWVGVDSEPGRGTTFEVLLPALAKGEAKTGNAGEPARPAPRGGTETILLVEDDQAVRALARMVLERGGYRVLEAASGAEALQLPAAVRAGVALLLTDLVMPGGISGQDLMRRLRTERTDLKVVYMSGYSADLAGRELELGGGARFLQKPFAYDLLLETVRQCLDG